MKKAGILLSGGLDSAVNAYLALKDNYSLKVAFFFAYGQLSYEKEKEVANWWARYWKIPLVEFDLEKIYKTITDKSPLQQPKLQVNLDHQGETEDSRNSVWIPNRNGVMINIAAAYLEKVGIKYLLTGFNLEEAKTFPDNSKEFLEAINKALSFSTLNGVKVESFTIDSTKTELVEKIKDTDFPLEKVWSCYFSGDKMCGECESCLRLKRALRKNKILNKYSYIFEK